MTPNQLTAAALVIQYWVPREKVNPGVFIAVFLVVIVAINYLGIKFFGEFEFWLSSIKVLTIVGLILLSLILMLGGGPDHDRKVPWPLISHVLCPPTDLFRVSGIGAIQGHSRLATVLQAIQVVFLLFGVRSSPQHSRILAPNWSESQSARRRTRVR